MNTISRPRQNCEDKHKVTTTIASDISLNNEGPSPTAIICQSGDNCFVEVLGLEATVTFHLNTSMLGPIILQVIYVADYALQIRSSVIQQCSWWDCKSIYPDIATPLIAGNGHFSMLFFVMSLAYHPYLLFISSLQYDTVYNTTYFFRSEHSTLGHHLVVNLLLLIQRGIQLVTQTKLNG
jgi:hypothetical protein